MMDRKVRVWITKNDKVVETKEVDIYDDLCFYEGEAVCQYELDDRLCTYAHDWLEDTYKVSYTDVLT